MEFDDDKIIEILRKLPSEGPCIDYKVIPYKKNQQHEFLQDVIAMLNSEAAVGKDKFIILGVSDSPRALVGIDREQWGDDNEWQNLIKKISPRPDVRTGLVKYLEKEYGYIYILGSNNEWVYEAKEAVVSSKEDLVKEKNIIAKGQAYTRFGSVNEVLMDDGRKRLLEKKIQQIPLEINTVDLSSEERSVLIALAMVGTWDEQYGGDKEVIEKLSGCSVEENKKVLRTIKDKNPELLKFSNNRWTLCNHETALVNEAAYIFDNHIDLFFEVIQFCLTETDPKYELPAEKRRFAALFQHGRNRKYSNALVSGLTETLAILGNHTAQFTNCSKHKVISDIYTFEREFFKAKDWKVYATCSDKYQMLGEACPDVFMDEICNLLRNKDEYFLQFLMGKEESITSVQYGYEIGLTLSNIAKLEKYFSKAIETLFLLAEIRPQFIETIVGIVLPWYPQTHASSEMRVGVFKGLAKENSSLTWDILMKLMPNVTTTGNPIQKPKYLVIEDIPENVTRADYCKTSVAYIRLAEEILNSDIERLCAIVSVIDDVDSTMQQEILDNIKKSSEGLDDKDKSILWNELKDFTHRHRKFPDAKWTLSEDRLVSVDEVAAWLVPNSEKLLSIRLFRNDQYSLLMDLHNYEEEEKQLRIKQRGIIKEIYDASGLAGLLRFVETVENKRLAGLCASEVLNDEDAYCIISNSNDITSDDFLDGIVKPHSFSEIASIIQDFSDTIKAEVLAKLPLTDVLIQYVEKLDEGAKKKFWEETEAWGVKNDRFSMLSEAVNDLNSYQQIGKSITLLYYNVYKNSEGVNPDLIIETLKLDVDNQDKNTYNEFHIQYLIKWLQEKTADRKTLIALEWKYLALLDEREGYPPLTLWEELSDNPDFYIMIVKIACGKEDESWDDDTKKRMAQRCFHLLQGWKRIPGLDANGQVDNEKLSSWFSSVKKSSDEYKITGMAMNYFGRTAFYAPPDRDGFFIDRAVAEYLHADTDGSILSGYRAEAIDSRGVYIVDSTGQTEFKLEEDYLGKARTADENGFFRLADILRSIAESYHEEGLRNQEMHWGED